jgi:hypothetical protein
MLDQVVEHFCRATGTTSYEEAFASLRTLFRDRSASPAAWIHALAQHIYPANGPDSVDPEQFDEILGQIDTREKCDSVLANLPEEEVPKAEKFLDALLKQILPAQRASAQNLVKALPPRRTGGPKSTIPSEAKCRQINKEISKLHADGVSLGTAQRRVATKWGKSLRTVQRIWALRRPKDARSE